MTDFINSLNIQLLKFLPTARDRGSNEGFSPHKNSIRLHFPYQLVAKPQVAKCQTNSHIKLLGRSELVEHVIEKHLCNKATKDENNGLLEDSATRRRWTDVPYFQATVIEL